MPFARLSEIINFAFYNGIALDTLDDIFSVLEHAEDVNGIYVDTTLEEDSLENRVVNTLMSSPQIRCLILSNIVGAQNIPQILRRAIQNMPSLNTVRFKGLRISTTEAQDIFNVMEGNASKLKMLILEDTNYNNSVVNVLCRYLRESSLRRFTLIHTGKEGTVRLSEAMFYSICDALCHNECLKEVVLNGCPLEDTHTEKAVEYFAKALVKS